VAILPSSTNMMALGTMILWFGWYGFNCGSTLMLTAGEITRLFFHSRARAFALSCARVWFYLTTAQVCGFVCGDIPTKAHILHTARSVIFLPKHTCSPTRAHPTLDSKALNPQPSTLNPQPSTYSRAQAQLTWRLWSP
jgi:hypothetical protein